MERIASFSTSDLAPILNATQNRIRLVWIVAAVALLPLIAAAQGNASLLPVALLFALVATWAATLLDRYRRSVRIEFKFEGLAGNIATALLGSFEDLQRCRAVWNVVSEGYRPIGKEVPARLRLTIETKQDLSWESLAVSGVRQTFRI